MNNYCQVIAEAIEKEKNVLVKGIDWDLVTEYDRKVEKTIISKLSAEFPTHKWVYSKMNELSTK